MDDLLVPGENEQYQFFVGHGKPFDKTVDTTVRSIAATAKLPQPVAHRLWSIWQDAAAKPHPSPVDAELTRRTAEARLRQHFGEDAFDQKIAAARSVFDGLPPEQDAVLKDALNRLAIGSDELLVRNLASLAEYRASAATKEEK